MTLLPWIAGITVLAALLIQSQAGEPWGILTGLTGLLVETAVCCRASVIAGRAADQA